MAKRVAVVLAGCGVFDGSEIHEASAVLVQLNREGAQVRAAPCPGILVPVSCSGSWSRDLVPAPFPGMLRLSFFRCPAPCPGILPLSLSRLCSSISPLVVSAMNPQKPSSGAWRWCGELPAQLCWTEQWALDPAYPHSPKGFPECLLLRIISFPNYFVPGLFLT